MVDLLPKLKQSPLVSGTRQPDGDAVVMGCGISPTHVDHGASEEHLQPPQTEHRPAAPGVAGHLAVVRSPKSQNPKTQNFRASPDQRRLPKQERRWEANSRRQLSIQEQVSSHSLRSATLTLNFLTRWLLGILTQTSQPKPAKHSH